MSNAVLEVEPEVVESQSATFTPTRTPLSWTPAPARTMFVDCLVEPAGWQRDQRRWTTLTSLSIQVLLLGVSLLIPLIFTEALPTQQLVTFLVAPPPPPPPPPPPVVAAAPVRQITAEIVSGRLVAPTKIPDQIKMIKEDEAPPAPAGFGVVAGVPGGVPGGQIGGVLGGIISSTAARTVQPVPPPARLRISQGVSAGQLINRVQPEYPTIAKAARIQGTVELTAWIGKDGTIERLTVVNGNPLLTRAAIEAVKQWRYRPFLLNGQPISVETTVQVIFSFSN